MQATGTLTKMKVQLTDTVNYRLLLNEANVEMNPFIGSEIQLVATGNKYCISCGRKTNKIFGQGFCFPCFQSAPENAECIIHPELCKGHLGEGRDMEWEKSNHVQPHYVYIALSSGVKVGVTRLTQVPSRWIDQGASQAIILAETPYRQLAGAIEVHLKNFMADKTNWQRMLKNDVEQGVDLIERKNAAFAMLTDELKQYRFPSDEIIKINYPVLSYPKKVSSLNFEKSPEIRKKLHGIKGQYLIFDDGSVLNIRNQSGYEITFEAR